MARRFLPAALVADIAGGTYPAVMNILLALRERDRTGRAASSTSRWPTTSLRSCTGASATGLRRASGPPGGDLVTGGSARYNIYRTRDGRFLAAAPLEQKFWDNFCERLDVPAAAARRRPRSGRDAAAVAERVRERTADELQALFRGHDVCCTIAASLENALNDPHFAARGVFARTLTAGAKR